jgi:hypothetical protein
MIYKMPYPVWERIHTIFEALTEEEVPYINMERCGWDFEYQPTEEYIKHEYGIRFTGEWSHPKMEDEYDVWEDEEELYHYRVVNKKKYAVFLLKWG